MTDILCTWLNDELKLSKRITTLTFAQDFSTGYLVGEVLFKSGLQEDFDQFSVATGNNARINNFTRVEPVLHLLGIPFDTNTARDMMTEISGVSTRLVYQMFISLKQKQKANLTGTAIETMRPAGPVKLESVGTEMYKERLRHMTPRQTDLDLSALAQRFHEHQIRMESTAFKERFEEQEKIRNRHADERAALIERSRIAKAKQTELMAKIEAATVEIPKPPAHKSAKALAKRRQLRVVREAQETMESIWEFEERMKSTMAPQATDASVAPPTSQSAIGRIEEETATDSRKDSTKQRERTVEEEPEIVKPKSNDEYIGKIRRRLNEDAAARAEREKRRRKVLVDQLQAHESMEDSRREEILVNRLMRQSQHERRIAVQLMQARREKDVIRNNRIHREKDYEERRTKDFNDALDREGEMARLAQVEYAEQTRKDKELHESIAAERSLAKYEKHYSVCADVLDGMVDFSCKVSEYRELTEDLVPAKLYREWRDLFITGLSLYQEAEMTSHDPDDMTPEMIAEENRQQLLDDGDFDEYKDMVGEWLPPGASGITSPPRYNPIVGHIVQRLFDIVYPPSPPPSPPQFPPFPIKACVVGKFFSGKSTCCRALANNRRVQIVNVDFLLEEAIEAYKNNEEKEEEPEPEPELEFVTEEEEAPTEDNPAQTVEEMTAPAVEEDTNKLQEIEETKEPSEKTNDGAEKSDPEKPVTDECLAGDKSESIPPEPTPSSYKYSLKSSRNVPSSNKPNLTNRAVLGGKAMKLLRKGKTVDEQILVDILAESVRQIPEGTGWIIDGFPTTVTQAKLMEKALSGFDADAKDAAEKAKQAKSVAKKKKSSLAPDPRPAPPPPEPRSGIDVIILVDTPDELCLRRSAGRFDAVQEGEVYHQEFKPPPEGSATGVGKQEKVLATQDAAHDQEQVQQRLSGFMDAWGKVEKWFIKFNILDKVDGSLDEMSLYTEVETILDQTLTRLQPPEKEALPTETEDAETKPETEPALPTPPEPEPEAEAEAVPEPVEEEKRSRPSSKKSRAGSGKRSGSGGSGKGRSKSPKKPKSPPRTGSGKKGSKSGGSSAKKGKKAASPEPEPEPTEPEVPEGPPPPEPGCEEWEFVDEPIDGELAGILAPYWEAVEDTYVDTSKDVFRSLRTEREAIIRYFFQTRQDFVAYLQRPDHKNEFVVAWQQDYNSVTEDVRDDEETKSELHVRVDDLRERLWTICDERKEQAEEERTTIMEDGWLDDRLGVISNYYISLLQVEVDRLQDTMRLLKDYYRGMHGQVPDEPREEFARIPLVELPTGRPESISGEGDPTQGDGEPASGKETPKSAKSGSASGKKSRQKEVEETADDGEKRLRIPLVPRRPTSVDLSTAAAKDKKDKKSGGKKGSAGEQMESPSPPDDPDERLVFDALWTAIHAVQGLLNAELAAREAEEEAEREKEEKMKKDSKAAATVDKGKKGGKKSGKKSRSPSPKKGKKEAAEPLEAPPSPPEKEESEEEKEKKRIKQKMKEELFFAYNEEVDSCKTRLSLINIQAATVLQELKNKADQTFKDLMDWLGARFVQEMESIDSMSVLVRNAIEEGKQLKQQIYLDQEDFIMADDVKVLRTPTPTRLKPANELIVANLFTVNQLYTMYKQFVLIAPEGNLAMKSFIDCVLDLINLTQGEEVIPEVWINVTTAQLETMAALLSPDGVYVDWKHFLVAVSLPVPRPSQTQLLDALSMYTDQDQDDLGSVTQEQFMQVDLWFSTETPRDAPVQPMEEGPYNRLAHLKRAYFDFFADHNQEPPVLDYTDMLMYFASDPDPFEGFLRALSLSSGTHMPRSYKVKNEQLVSNSAEVLSRQRQTSTVETPAEIMDVEGDVIEIDDVTGFDDDVIPLEDDDAIVYIDHLLAVLHHSERSGHDAGRFIEGSDTPDALSKDRLSGVYHELGAEEGEPVLFYVLVQHPVIQDILATFNRFKAPDLDSILVNVSMNRAGTAAGEFPDNTKTPE